MTRPAHPRSQHNHGEDQGHQVWQGNREAPELLPVGCRLRRSRADEVGLHIWRFGAEKLFDCREFAHSLGGGPKSSPPGLSGRFRQRSWRCFGWRNMKRLGGFSRAIFCFAAFLSFFLSSACARSPVLPKIALQPGPITLTIGLPVQTGENPLYGASQVSRLFDFEGLTCLARDGRPQPRLAERWTESSDGLTWTIHLRSNAFFHDGTRELTRLP